MTNNAHSAHQPGTSTTVIRQITRQPPPRPFISPVAGPIQHVSARRKEAGTMNTPQVRRPADQASRNHDGPKMRVSRLTVPVLAAMFMIGLAKGAIAYSRRSSVLKAHVAGTNAITVHIVIAIVAAAAVIFIQVRRWRMRDKPGSSPWIAPFSSSAMARMSRAIRLSPGAAAVRALPMALLTLVLLYAPYRMGAQIIGGLDPNSTVNAWGGPSYAGAMLAHWLDCIVGFYVAAFLLGRLLPATSSPDQTQS
jgi:hypothetical protein